MLDSYGMKVGERLDSTNHPENRPDAAKAGAPGLENLELTLTRLVRLPVRIRAMTPLARAGSTRAPGCGVPLRIDYEVSGERRAAFLETFGDSVPAGSAAKTAGGCGKAKETAPPDHHVRVLGAGQIKAGDGLVSEAPGEAKSYFRISEFAEGRAYGEDLVRLKLGGYPKPLDFKRAEALAGHLAELHRTRGADSTLYRAHVRELIGGADGILGLLDGFPPEEGLLIPELLEHLEHRSLKWRWRLKEKTQRLRRIHGDFNPWKVLFQDGIEFSVVDAAEARWGEPADDVAGLTAHYLLFALQSTGESRRTLFELYSRFWSEYIDKSGDSEILDVAAPFVVRHLLALASPAWAPDLKINVRRSLFSFMFRVLDVSRFDPHRLEEVLRDD